MKTVDLSKGQHTLSEVLALAKSEPVLIHSVSGEDFILEQADDFDREVAALGSSAKFSSFLMDRSREGGDIPIEDVRKKRGI
ncbi:MAG TPA: hypothetical protein VLT62_02555 [Candidatus Methylomirabilis sp.]|nr:hypothetical protein [Candidatus Methylomirabilis sp.]